jgi:hypothetical protein
LLFANASDVAHLEKAGKTKTGAFRMEDAGPACIRCPRSHFAAADAKPPLERWRPDLEIRTSSWTKLVHFKAVWARN